MKTITVSFDNRPGGCTEKHDLRELGFHNYKNHINIEQTHLNEVLIQRTVKEVYEELFSEAIKEFDAKQVRNKHKSACIGSAAAYYENTALNYEKALQAVESASTAEERSKAKSILREAIKPVYHCIVQFDKGEYTKSEEAYQQLMREYVKSFEENNKNMRIVTAVIHNDEESSHLHIAYVPYKHSKRGLSVSLGFTSALKEQGTNLQEWTEGQRNILTTMARGKGYEVLQGVSKERKHLNEREYKEYKELLNSTKQELKELQQEVKLLSSAELKKCSTKLDKIRHIDEIYETAAVGSKVFEHLAEEHKKLAEAWERAAAVQAQQEKKAIELSTAAERAREAAKKAYRAKIDELYKEQQEKSVESIMKQVEARRMLELAEKFGLQQEVNALMEKVSIKTAELAREQALQLPRQAHRSSRSR